jgi:DNA-binding NarL/FixJ family response regulator
MEPIRVLLVEDHQLVREGTRELLEREDDLAVVAEAQDGEEAVRLAVAHEPDVVLMDIALPALDGIEATRRIKRSHPDIAVLALTAYDDDQHVTALLEAGAAGYLLKDVSAAALAGAIRAVHAGESVLHPDIAQRIISRLAEPRPSVEARRPPRPEAPATDRERQVLFLAAEGMTNREIANQLGISARTVQVHLSNLFTKMGVASRTEAVLTALRQGWLSLDQSS